MYSYSYSNLDRLKWLDETLKKGSLFALDDEPPLRSYHLWKKARDKEALRKSDQMHQTCKKSSLAMTHKLDGMIELPKLQPKKTYDEDLVSENQYQFYGSTYSKNPTCLRILLGYPLDLFLGDEVENPSPQSTPQVLPSSEEYTPLVTYPKEVEETLGAPMAVEHLDETQLEDLGLNTCNNGIPLSFREVLSVDELEPQPQPYQIVHP
nr:ribonuclease H-like domain-containing protein [Tanacetum cinerariifolium]